jgi:large subunit ribosomal protein LP0
MSKGEKKANYFAKLTGLLTSYTSIFLVTCDNVGSNQLHQIRISLRGEAEILMGKNTMIRKVVKSVCATNPAFERLLPHLKGNVGLVFTKGELSSIKEQITSNRVQAPAKAGAIAPIDVFVPGGNTGMEPGKTSFFQALGIPTKISRGTIEIINDVHLVAAGNKVGASEAALLNMLNISPFTYGMTVKQIYDNGVIFSPEVLDITEDQLIGEVKKAIVQVASLSLRINFPTLASVPHSIINACKDLINVSLATDYTFDKSAQLKEILANPEAFLAAAPAAAPAASDAPAAAAKEEEKEESDEDMGFGLFD